jgi:hypothetical protein
MAVEIDVGADDGRIARKQTGPRLMAKNQRVPVGAFERGSSEQNARAEHVEIVVRDERGGERTPLRRDKTRAFCHDAVE